MDEGQNEGNNSAFRAIPITVPDVDLQVTSVSSPDAALSGQVITVSWMVRNTGTIGTFAPQWTDSVFLSRDQILDTTDRTIGFKAHNGALAAGASYTETLDVTVPGGLTGPYDVLVAADVRNQIYETDESNNSGVALSAVTLELPAPADLKVTLVEPPASGSPGEEATIRWTVLNQGPNVATGNWTDAIYLSKDQVWDIDDALVSRADHSGPLRVGQSYIGTLTTILPAVDLGVYHAIARTDVRNTVRESDETNNTTVSTGTMTVDVVELILEVPFT